MRQRGLCAKMLREAPLNPQKQRTAAGLALLCLLLLLQRHQQRRPRLFDAHAILLCLHQPRADRHHASVVVAAR